MTTRSKTRRFSHRKFSAGDSRLRQYLGLNCADADLRPSLYTLETSAGSRCHSDEKIRFDYIFSQLPELAVCSAARDTFSTPFDSKMKQTFNIAASCAKHGREVLDRRPPPLHAALHDTHWRVCPISEHFCSHVSDLMEIAYFVGKLSVEILMCPIVHP